jgi:hypothetical protein
VREMAAGEMRRMIALAGERSFTHHSRADGRA